MERPNSLRRIFCFCFHFLSAACPDRNVSLPLNERFRDTNLALHPLLIDSIRWWHQTINFTGLKLKATLSVKINYCREHLLISQQNQCSKDMERWYCSIIYIYLYPRLSIWGYIFIDEIRHRTDNCVSRRMLSAIQCPHSALLLDSWYVVYALFWELIWH